MRTLLVFLCLLPALTKAQINIRDEHGKNTFSIAGQKAIADILYDTSDFTLVQKAAGFLADDIKKVTGRMPKVTSSPDAPGKNIIIVASLGHNSLIDQLIKAKKFNADVLKGQWERFIIQTIKKPFSGVDNALIILGSDRRGAAYGVFSISKEIGVSPLHWWADVPAMKHDQLFLENVRYVSKSPTVKYRGIFINDEAPALYNWAQEKFGGFNHKFYENVFELILRNKGNFLWPAMWPPTSFFDDDPENLRAADAYGIVVSTSHHEPMMRSHEDWGRFGGKEWNYKTNSKQLQEFWRTGMERFGDNEGVVTMGMRGDGDEAMSEETAVDLLQNIISDQRKIIEEVTGKPAEKTPQVWAIYKEVQDYYDKGMRVDDDITILFCDDNWGNIRILPKKEDLGKKGGFGIYYHFDFVGGPVSYRWLNVRQIEKVWEQMNLAYEWGVRDIWLVNVGDIKPMELPISFFLDFAFDTDAIRADDLPDYYIQWAKLQFGGLYTRDIAEILSLYTKYNARRTPEMLSPENYSLSNYREADKVVEDYNELLDRSRKIYDQLPENYKSAFYQLVLSPVEMCSNLNEMYVAAGKNKFYAELGSASANYYADKVIELFNRDEELARIYHEDLEEGKWNHMMSQTHIGYTSWDHPPANKMPAVSYIQANKNAGFGYIIEHGAGFRFNNRGINSRSFSPFDRINDQTFYVEIFNKGNDELDYTIDSKDSWILISSKNGSVKLEEKVYVHIDWDKAPEGISTGEIEISGAGRKYVVSVPIRNEDMEVAGFVENNGVVSIEASNFTRKKETKDITWSVVPNLGRTGSSLIVEPANADTQTPADNTPYVEYDFTVFKEGALKIDTYLSPTLNYKKKDGLKYAVAIDDETPHIINIHEGETQPDWTYPAWWNTSVTDHIRKKQSSHGPVKPGKHTLKIWMIDPGVVFQKFVINAGGLRPSYLGPPESIYVRPCK